MERHETVLQTVARVLGDAFPDAEVVDRDVLIDRERSIQLAAVDASGRLMLVLVVEAAHDEVALTAHADVALTALDALVFARRNAAVLSSHFHS